jgi:hypothetical protein
MAKAGCVAVLMAFGSSAQARIECRDGFQVSGGQEISTPYCNDNYVAQLARARGMKVTDEEVRNNPARKDEVCRIVGNDPRVRDYCRIDNGGGRSRF